VRVALEQVLAEPTGAGSTYVIGGGESEWLLSGDGLTVEHEVTLFVANKIRVWNGFGRSRMSVDEVANGSGGHLRGPFIEVRGMRIPHD